MAIRESILPEFDHEMANTRKMLERVPEGNWGWKPHDKSMTLSRLASHLAEIPGWGATILEKDAYDMAPQGGRSYVRPMLESRAEILDLFDANVAKARGRIAEYTDAEFMKPWSMQKGGQTMFTMPRLAVVRNLLLNHIIHHRGQFSVYLRMQGVPLPGLYGPTADEQPM
jgi:uncharacterized damage-inducible protein DinB